MNIKTISPVLLAEKLQMARHSTLPRFADVLRGCPRLVDALWYLQWISLPENLDGGIQKFAESLVDRYPQMIGPQGLRFDRPMTFEEIEAAIASLDFGGDFPTRERFIMESVLDDLGTDGPGHQADWEADYREAVIALDAGAIHRQCIEAAKARLGQFLSEFCTVQNDLGSNEKPFPWYFARLWECVFDAMDRQTRAASDSLAETSLTKQIFGGLETAQELGKGVMFIGQSRFGKSHAIRAYAKMFPWKARVVECPSGGSEGDLLREINRALGIHNARTFMRLHEQREAIDLVAGTARFLLIFDEAQMLYPQNGNRRIAPGKLNYVRRQFMDKGIPTAFVCTPQNWKRVEWNYLRTSGFAQDQIEGRFFCAPIQLPEELSKPEMISVARLHIPEASEALLEYMVVLVRNCNGDRLSYIESIAQLARRGAKRRGESVPGLQDVKSAVDNVFGCFRKTAPNAPEKGKQPLRKSGPQRKRIEPSNRRTLTDSEALSPAHGRGIAPAGFAETAPDPEAELVPTA